MPRSRGWDGGGEETDALPRERDPMTDEVFDIELDIDVTFGMRVDSFDVHFPPTRVNSGRFTASANLVSLGLQYRFN